MKRHSSQHHIHYQTPLPLDLAPPQYPLPSTEEERGAVFTRPEIVTFILDLVGYTSDKPLHRMRLLEPSIGHGDFLLPAIDRLISAWRADTSHAQDINLLKGALQAVELHPTTFATAHQRVIDQLVHHGFSPLEARNLADAWLIQADFLLLEQEGLFHFIVGNPPYVRQERIPDALLAEYRSRFTTLYDRADLYIPFIEKSLLLLEEAGQLGFICSDRWMKNRYGAPLRQLVAQHFHLKIYVDMVDTPAFQSDVIAYPAITIIARQQGSTTRVAYRPTLNQHTNAALVASLTNQKSSTSAAVQILDNVASGADPWILEASEQLQLLRRLEASFPTLAEAGCYIGIGVATGADKAFIAPYQTLDVEPDRKLPLVTTRDLVAGQLNWQGLGIINPFNHDGSLVELADYPRLQAYLEQHQELIRNRHIAQKNPKAWYRTIDRINPSLTTQPKLLIPDIKGEAHIVYDSGQFYPHHNLYYITSEHWPLKLLQVILNLGIAHLFVSTYSVRMRGGYLRFQAQYLRRIRIPAWQTIPPQLQTELLNALEQGDKQTYTDRIYHLYGLSTAEQQLLASYGADPACHST